LFWWIKLSVLCKTIVTRVFQIANGACFARAQSYRSKKQLTALGRAHIIISALVT